MPSFFSRLFVAMEPQGNSKKPYLVVFVIQTIYAGMLLLSKAAFNQGMNSFLFVFYRQAAATLVLIPVAFIFERNRALPLSWVEFFKIFMLSLFGITFSLNIHGIALIYTSATLAAATSNTLPVITFFLALLFRMETVNLKTHSGVAKIMGVVLCVVGAVVLGFYNGPHIKSIIHHPLFRHPSNIKGVDHQGFVSSSHSWIIGCSLMLIANFSWGLWFVLQVRVMEAYPSKLIFTTLQCLLSTIQSFVLALAFNRNIYQWKLHFDIGLLAVAYSGIIVSGVIFYLQAWCIEKKGPVFLAMSTPLCLIITIICSIFFLGEIISLGSVLGGIILVGGLYSVLWGKRKEERTKSLIVDEDVRKSDKEKQNAETQSLEVI